jgi:hypothetical protein
MTFYFQKKILRNKFILSYSPWISTTKTEFVPFLNLLTIASKGLQDI